MNANCNLSPTSTGVRGRTLDATTATILTVSMTDASNTSSTTMAVAATTSALARRVSPSARTRASSPNAYRVSTPIPYTMSAVLIHAAKSTNNNNMCKQQKTGKNNAHDDCWTSSKLSCLTEPVTPSLLTKGKHKQQQQKNYHFCSNPKIKRMLVVQ